MKRLFNRIKATGKLSILDFFVPFLAILASIVLLILDFSEVIHMNLSDRIGISIILLAILISTSLIERYGILGDIHERFTSLDNNRPYLIARKQYENTHQFNDMLSDSTEINLLAIANTSFLRGNGITRLKDASRMNIKVKLLSLDPKSNLASIYESSKILNDLSTPLSENIEDYLKARKGDKQFQNNIELRVCDTIIPYSLMILKTNKQVKMIKIDLYSVGVEYTQRRSIVIPSSDTENIKFFLSQWNLLWEGSKDNVIK